MRPASAPEAEAAIGPERGSGGSLPRRAPLRVVLHVHSTWSYDGHWALGDLARLYGRLGIGAVMMTEHDTDFDPARFADYRAACAAASTKHCRLIPGIEYSSPDNRIHLLTWGLRRFLAEHRPVEETLAAVAAEGGVAVLAHPARKAAHAAYDEAWTPALAGIELWNRKADGLSWGSEARALIARTGLPATVGQDFHRLKQLYPLTMTLAASGGAGRRGLRGPQEAASPLRRPQAVDPAAEDREAETLMTQAPPSQTPAVQSLATQNLATQQQAMQPQEARGLEAVDLEAVLVEALREGRLRPELARRPLLGPDGQPQGRLPPRLEALRRALRDRLRRGGGKS